METLYPNPYPLGSLDGMKAVEKIVWLCTERGITQAAVERAVGLSENRISKWKDDVGEMTASQAYRLAKFFDVPVAWLVNDSINGGPPESSTEVSEDEQAILIVYRDLRQQGQIDRPRAISGLALAARLPSPSEPSVIPGQSAMPRARKKSRGAS